MQVHLIRVSENLGATLGMLSFNGMPDFWSLERLWSDNKPFISRIPSGLYVCRRIVSPRFGATFEICDVLGRTHIEFHWGNFVTDTTGCVLVGYAPLLTSRGVIVTSSQRAHGDYMKKLQGIDEFDLNVSDPAQ